MRVEILDKGHDMFGMLYPGEIYTEIRTLPMVLSIWKIKQSVRYAPSIKPRSF
jgi:hypothetical protein